MSPSRRSGRPPLPPRHTRVLPYVLSLAIAVSNVGLSQTEPTADTVTVRSGELHLRAVLWRPGGAGPFPGILVNHGRYRPGETLVPDDPGPLGRLFAEHGYVALVLFRRGVGPSAEAGPSEGDLMAQAQAEGGQAGENRVQLDLLEGEALNEAIAGLTYLRSLPIVKPARVGTVGHSFGGSLSILLAAHDSTISSVVVFGAAAGSWGPSPELQQRLRGAVARARADMFFIHAANDYSVAPGQALSVELERIGKPHRLKIYPSFGTTTKAGHNLLFRSPATWQDDVFDFLDGRLKR